MESDERTGSRKTAGRARAQRRDALIGSLHFASMRPVVLLAASVVLLSPASTARALGAFASTVEYGLDVDASTASFPDVNSVLVSSASLPVDEMLDAQSTFSDGGSSDLATASAELEMSDTALEVTDLRASVSVRTLRELEDVLAFAAVFVQRQFSTDASGGALTLDGTIVGGTVIVQKLDNGEIDIANFGSLDGLETVQLDPDADFQLVVDLSRTVTGADQQALAEIDLVATVPEASGGLAGACALASLGGLRRARSRRVIDRP